MSLCASIIAHRNEGEMWSVRVFDPQLLAKVQAGALADCIWASMDVYIKLVKINPRRVRGRRCIDGVPEATNHYWVEAGDTVFDYHGGVAQTLAATLSPLSKLAQCTCH